MLCKSKCCLLVTCAPDAVADNKAVHGPCYTNTHTSVVDVVMLGGIGMLVMLVIIMVMVMQ